MAYAKPTLRQEEQMPLRYRTTLTQYLIQERRRFPDSKGDFNALILDVALACKAIARAVSMGELGGVYGDHAPEAGGSINVQGETQKKLDVLSNDLFVRMNQWGGHLAGMASEEMSEPYQIPSQHPRGKYLLVFDPLDGSSNIDVNVSVGSIFSVLRAPQEAIDNGRDITEQDFLQTGATQVAAGYALYGPTTMLVLTVGNGVVGFTLDPNLGEYMLTHGKDFNMRWIASMVAEAHRILMRGGVFMYPRDTKDPSKAGRLRLLYEANPIGMVMEQAGGRASTGREPMLSVQPSDLHQRIGLVFGSKNEVERIEQYHREPLEKEHNTPLFAERTLFRD